jgi:hypothetical protein
LKSSIQNQWTLVNRYIAEGQAETTRVLLLRVYPHVLWKSELFGAMLECSQAKCRLFPRRTDRDVELWTRQETEHAQADQPRGCREKKPKAFLSYRSPYGTFFVVGGYPLVSGLTPAAESFSSPGLLEDSAHWTIAELCRNSSTPCEVGPCLKG